MAGGGKVRIIDRDSSSYDATARVVNGRLLVDGGGGGGTSDVNLVSIGGVAVTTPLAVTGTVNVGNFPATVAVTQSTSPWVVSGTVTANQGTSPWVVSGTVNVGGTVAVTQSTSPWVVSGTVAVSAVAGNVTVVQSTHDNLNLNANLQVNNTDVALANPVPVNIVNLSVAVTGTVTVSQITTNIVPGTGGTSLGKAEDSGHVSGHTGVMSLAVRNDTPGALATTDLDYIPLTTDSQGNLRVGGVGTQALGKAEDALHASGDVGVMALAVRSDTGAVLAGNGDYIPLMTNPSGALRTMLQDADDSSIDLNFVAPGIAVSDPITGIAACGAVSAADPSGYADGNFDRLSLDTSGYLRVRVKGAPMAPIAFSASTRGRPVQITATATAGTTIHTATTTSGEKDKVFVFLTNTSASAVTVTFEFGTTGTANNVVVQVPGNATVLAINGGILGGAATDTLAAFASTASVVNAFGYVERFAA